MVFLGPYRQMLVQPLKLGHDHSLPQPYKLQSGVIKSLDNIHSLLLTKASLNKPYISDLHDTLHSSLLDCLQLTYEDLQACDLHNNFSGTVSA